MKNMDNKHFKNPLINPVAISRVTLPLLNTGEHPLALFYIGVNNELQFHAFPIIGIKTEEEGSKFIEKAVRYIKMEYSTQYAIVNRLEPGDFITIDDVDKIMAERKQADK